MGRKIMELRSPAGSGAEGTRVALSAPDLPRVGPTKPRVIGLLHKLTKNCYGIT